MAVMKFFFFIFILFSVIVFQTSFLPFLSPYGVKPNLILILVLGRLIFASSADFVKLLSESLLAALLADLFSGFPFGLVGLSFLTTVYLIDWLNRNIFGRINFWTVSFLVFIATLFYDLVLVGLAGVVFGGLAITSFLFFSIFLETAYNIILLWFLFYGVKKILYQNYYSSKY